tara:strand:- start:87749 stop:88222 length:474 start_codon:yes stop_codon:yes gene_type:complete
MGEAVNYRGVANTFESLRPLFQLGEHIQWIKFCPELVEFGVPREPVNISGGAGAEVWSGKAKVFTHSGVDVTEKMKSGADQLLGLCKRNAVKIALLMEGSPSCGSHWVFNGEAWPEKQRIVGSGVTSALLEANGIQVLSPADEKSLGEFADYIRSLT